MVLESQIIETKELSVEDIVNSVIPKDLMIKDFKGYHKNHNDNPLSRSICVQNEIFNDYITNDLSNISGRKYITNLVNSGDIGPINSVADLKYQFKTMAQTNFFNTGVNLKPNESIEMVYNAAQISEKVKELEIKSYQY